MWTSFADPTSPNLIIILCMSLPWSLQSANVSRQLHSQLQYSVFMWWRYHYIYDHNVLKEQATVLTSLSFCLDLDMSVPTSVVLVLAFKLSEVHCCSWLNLRAHSSSLFQTGLKLQVTKHRHSIYCLYVLPGLPYISPMGNISMRLHLEK